MVTRKLKIGGIKEGMTMKKFITNIRTVAALLIASATFVACSSDNDITADQPAQPSQPAGKQVYTLTVPASKGSDATTRGLSLVGSTLNAIWKEDEKIKVYNLSDEEIGELSPTTFGEATTTLTGTIDGTDVGQNLTLKFLSPNYTSQDGTLAYIEKNCDYATANVTVSAVSGTNISTTAANFTNQQAIVKFTLVDKADATTPLNPTELTVSDGTNTTTLTGISTDTYTTNGNGVLYVALPGFSDQTVTLTATVGDDTYVCERANVTFVNGQYYAINVKMSKQVAATDLSMVDCAGNDRASRWTANCYMVHTAGDYKLPLVYGNAIKDGADNTTAYKPGGTTGDTYCANFVNHNGEAITAPWIKDNGITVESAELLWQDAEDLVTAVDISGDYLTLTVGKDATGQEGNAVVAAKDADGNIVWSWHIWVTKQTFAATDLTTVTTGSHNYTVTPVNLGWVSTSADGKQGYSTFYQWGRKDAFKGTGAPTDDNVYNINGTTVTGLTYISNNTATIADNIKNPTTFYNVSSSSKPSTAKYFNLWDAQQTGADNITTATKKTVYDPSPAGFCVPTGNLYYYFGDGSMRSIGPSSSSSWVSTNKGATWNLNITGNALFFPASGYRYSDAGILGGVGSTGYYWSASVGSNTYYDYARDLRFTQNNWLWRNNEWSLGCSVRAVAEE